MSVGAYEVELKERYKAIRQKLNGPSVSRGFVVQPISRLNAESVDGSDVTPPVKVTKPKDALKAKYKMIIETVALCHGVSVASIYGRGRKNGLPRRIVYWLMRNVLHYSYPQIGRMLGDRDHTTILQGCRIAERLRVVNAPFNDELQYYKRMILEMEVPKVNLTEK